MKVNKPVGRKDHSDPLVAYVVVGDGPRAGEIKTVRYNYNMWADHMLTVEAVKQDGVVTHIESVRVRGNLAERDWFILDDEYDEMEKRQGDGYWARAKEAWYRYQSLVDQGKVRKPSFPDSLMPPRVAELKKNSRLAERASEAWDPSIEFGDLIGEKPEPESNAMAEAEPDEPAKPKRGRPKKDAAPKAESAAFDDAGDLPLPRSL